MQWHIGASAGAVNRMSRLGLVWATLVEFGLHARNMKSNIQNEVWISENTIISLILLVYILHITCNKNTDIETGKID